MYYNVGSPAYMAPESIVGSLYNENSEVWSLGVIFYEMLEGKPYASGDKQVMQTIMNIKRNGPMYPRNAS
jgi:5'-AMP-activated protein kinase catalytic alpha subunit/serine/threonine-protein kinase ULK/ATG1/calcium-dependent protein kinase